MALLYNLIKSELHIKKSHDNFNLILADTCQYIIGSMSAFDYQRALQAKVDFSTLSISAKDFRLMVLALGRYTLNLKLYLLTIIKTTRTPKMYSSWLSFRVKTCRDARVHLVDGELCAKAIEPFRTTMRRNKHVVAIPKEIVNPRQLLHWNLKFNSVVYRAVMKTIRQITFHRLRFISSSTNTDLADLHGDLAIKALQSYYRLVPTTEDDAYIINYLRRAVSNHAKNIIKTYTSQKRGRMVRSGADGFGGSNFDLIVVSENQIKANSDGDVVSYDQIGDADNSFDGMHNIEARLSIEALRMRYRAMPLRYKVLRLVLGDEDEGFTRFLRARGVLRVGTNSEYQDRCPSEKYNRLIAEYVDVRHSDIQKFIEDDLGSQYIGKRRETRYARCG